MGNARTALFNYLFAKQQNGIFIVRVEDTDKERSKPEWEKDALENLQALGLEWDEGPTTDGEDRGEYGPYRQSKRTELYTKYLQQLLDEDKAYYCFCDPEELEAHRQELSSRGEAPKYSGKCKSLSREEQEERISSEKSVIRFRVEPKIITFTDLVRGDIPLDMGLVGDTVIAKDPITPLYNFTVVIDDKEMEISHVIRGEDHISNTPKQILLQKALGFSTPVYAHLPLILAQDKTKLSKRHGDNSVTRFLDEGYLPVAVINFLALLGWNPGDERELFSLSELVKEFSVEKVHKGGAVFNLQKFEWLNSEYIKKMPLKELTKLCIPYLPQENLPSEGYLEKAIALYQDRLKKLSDISGLIDFLLVDTLTYDSQLLSWKGASKEERIESLTKSKDILQEVKESFWTEDTLSKVLLAEAEKDKDRGKLLWPLRVALSGKKNSAGPFEIAAVLGKEKTLKRIEKAL
tara:strand:- start:318 stop:1706 length:1389 start_codon:yes stop_codon:yes gene_type:complete